MAQIGQLKVVEDKAADLETILEYVKDPKGFIDSVKSDVKTVYGLREDEQKKAAEARILINEHKAVLDAIKAETAKHEANKMELSARESVLTAAQKAHAENIRIRNEEYQANVQALAEEKRLFDAHVDKEDKRIKAADDGFKVQVNNLKNEKEDLAKEKIRVSSIEKEALALKAKYEKKLKLIQADVE